MNSAMKILISLIFVIVCHFGFSKLSCPECECCNKGENYCDSNKKCINGCIAGYYGDKCTNMCLENCKTCNNGYECTECQPGYYRNQCTSRCGKGCVNNTCNILDGTCSCRSTDFFEGKCDACLIDKYGHECNNTCPTNCGSCISDTDCLWCINTLYYGSYCQYRCAFGCGLGRCYKATGHCLHDCTPRYTGAKCDACLPGLYGKFCDLNCTENCSSCNSKTNCTECKGGYYSETCTKRCPTGCKGNCSISDGRCLDCKTGFYGVFCNNTCKDGTFGYNCSRLCHDFDTHCLVCFENELGHYGGCTQSTVGVIKIFLLDRTIANV